MPGPTTYPTLDDEAVHAIARLFSCAPTLEPYSPDGGNVYRLAPGGAADGVVMLLWPSLSRVDVSSIGEHSWVLKNVGEVDVIEGTQAIFRPNSGRGYLFVAVNGRVNMVMG